MRKERVYDAVVVGAGNGGLAAAAQLAAKGRRVLLLERHNIVGGFSTSFVRGRFEFEASLHELCDLGSADRPGGVRKFFDEIGVQVDWMPVPEAYRLIIPSAKLDCRMPFGVEAYLDAMEARVPGSRESVAAFLELCREYTETFEFVEACGGKADPKVMLKRFPNFVKTAAYSVADVTRRLRMPEPAKDILYGYWCYLGLPMEKASMILYGSMLYYFLTQGAYIPRLRSTEFALALERRIIELGGEVECGVEVAKILVEGGRVRGVATAKGEIIRAGHVICNASPTAAYLGMIDPASESKPRLANWVDSRDESVTAVVTYLGLDSSPEELGLEDYTYLVYDDRDLGSLYRAMSEREGPRVQATVCLNRAVPDCSPPGTTILSLTSIVKPEAWRGVRACDYAAKKREFASVQIGDFERATGIRVKEHIEEIEIAAPATYARYTAAPQGIIYGYETGLWDSIIPRMMMMEEDELVKGLKFASGYGMRTIGFSSALAAGQIMALLADRDLSAMSAGEGPGREA